MFFPVKAPFIGGHSHATAGYIQCVFTVLCFSSLCSKHHFCQYVYAFLFTITAFSRGCYTATLHHGEAENTQKDTSNPEILANHDSISMLPFGKHTKSYWTLPFIVELPIKNVIFNGYVSLPEGISVDYSELDLLYYILQRSLSVGLGPRPFYVIVSYLFFPWISIVSMLSLGHPILYPSPNSISHVSYLGPNKSLMLSYT